MDEQGREELPEWIALPVLRPDYCDQQTTDEILKRLWENAPELVAALAAEERWPFPESRGSAFRDACTAIEYHLLDHEAALPKSNAPLAMIELLYELSRRLRKAQGLHEMPVFGKPLAPSPQGPFPALLSKPVSGEQDWRSEPPMSQALADKICQLAYEQEPVLIYALCEQRRRLIVTGEIEEALKNLITRIKTDEGAAKMFGFRAELRSRLDEMCAMPTYEHMAALIGAPQDTAH